jgi:hypothetical protein
MYETGEGNRALSRFLAIICSNLQEQIEWLIENKYMRRDENNINMFIYIA